jgi:TRAP-type C4-dicarboxylate transport system substrate-binding protein
MEKGANMKRLLLISVIVITVIPVLIGCSQQTSSTPATQTSSTPASSAAPAANVIELSFNLPIPPTHSRWLRAIEPWTKEIEAASNGRLKITPYFSESLSTLPENYDSVVNGIADLGESFIGAKVGRLPLIENLLGTAPPSLRMKNGAAVVWKLYQESPALQDEFKEVKVLFLHASPPQAVVTSKKQIKSVADMKGLKYEVSGGALPTQIAAALGASVVQMGMADIYMGLEKGVIDGATGDYELMVARKWGDILKYYTTMSITTSTFYCVMNKDKYNSLPPDLQKIIDDYSGDHAVDLFGKARWDIDMENKATWEGSMGGTTIYLSADELAKADAIVQPVIDKYVADMDAKGYPYSDLHQKFLELAKEQAIPWP